MNTETSLLSWREKPARAHPEDDLQKAIVAHLRVRGHKDCLWYHPMNNAPVSKRTAGRFKALGVNAGVPDLCFVLPDGSPAFMELKAGRNKQSPDQVKFAERCERIGVPYAVCYDLDASLEVLKAWGAIR